MLKYTRGDHLKTMDGKMVLFVDPDASAAPRSAAATVAAERSEEAAAQAAALQAAAREGVPFCEECEKKRKGH
ncbi:MAG TPA: hypothetical protein VFE90_17665 [Myxococcales bacterium]|jgi:hypothetical protein|nr:hypothetical protein [Myxococcales bacterium]